MPEIRPAAPADVPLVARVLEMASRGHLARGAWDLVFPDPGERTRALTRIAGGEPSWCHRALFHVADFAGVPGAALASFDPAVIGGTDLGGVLGGVFADLGWTDAQRGAAVTRVVPYLRCFPDLPEGTWIVENVGTLPQARRRGLVAALLEHALEIGRARGYVRAQISCLIGNEPAWKAYEAVGFEVVEERKDPEFETLFGSPGYVRMVAPLGGTR
jgi:ribosomal protein S18 acetylase RimI-like enzyme